MGFDICMVNPFFHPYDGGVERRIRAVGKRLTSNHKVNIVTSQLPGTKTFEKIDGIGVHRLSSRFFHVYNPPVVFTRGVEEKIRELNPDLIHLHYRWAPQYTKAVASFLGEVPVVFTWHNSFGEGVGWQRPFSFLNDEFFKHLLAKKCDSIICVSNYLKRQLSNHGIPDEILEEVHNGIDLQEKSQEEEDFILYVGRLVQTKGLDVLAEAMKKIDSKLLICGQGPESDELEESNNIELLGYVSEDEKNRLLRKCKFLVLPSKKEAFGITLLEAMTAGKTVVASKVGGIPEVVGNAGLLVPPGNPGKLSDKINQLLLKDDLREELSERAWKRAKQFSWDQIATQVENVYREALSGH